LTIKVAIDGPAGAGKSTIAKHVARQMGIPYVDTGAIYRSLTWQSVNANIPLDDENALAQLAEGLDILFIPDGESQRVIVRGLDITQAIREPEISGKVSLVAKYPQVRRKLLAIQSMLSQSALGVVMDGRDIGTSILPDADVKIFLTAKLEVRARRRFEEMKRQGFDVELEKVLLELEARDQADKQRKASPLRMAEDAVALDTSLLTIEEASAMVAALCEVRLKNKGVQ
jgi:cytidylate kinase